MSLNDLSQAVFAANVQALTGTGLRPFINTRVKDLRREMELRHPNPLLRHSAKYYSQNGEDGILLELIRRIQLDRKITFIEFGADSGLENNTVNLIIHGHRGIWVGADDLVIQIPPHSSKLAYLKTWISAENANQLYQEGLRKINASDFDLLSIDLDGIDIYMLESLLNSGCQPGLIVCEYNGKFPPPVKFRVNYHPQFRWDGSDYFGASLQEYNDTLKPFGYKLVCCDISGVNSFWVHQKYQKYFSDVPEKIEDLFIPADYSHLYRVGHAPSPRTIESFL